MKNGFIKATAAGLGVLVVGGGLLYQTEQSLKSIDIENCESVPQYCPYKEIKLADTGGADYDQIGMQILFDQLEVKAPARIPAGP